MLCLLSVNRSWYQLPDHTLRLLDPVNPGNLCMEQGPVAGDLYIANCTGKSNQQWQQIGMPQRYVLVTLSRFTRMMLMITLLYFLFFILSLSCFNNIYVLFNLRSISVCCSVCWIRGILHLYHGMTLVRPSILHKYSNSPAGSQLYLTVGDIEVLSNNYLLTAIKLPLSVLGASGCHIS